jgi:CRP-like cAMP-binding protein
LLRPSLERLERARNSVGALPARRASLAVPDPDVVRRKQDEAILASLSGDMSAVNGEGSSVMVASVFKETLSQVQKVGTFFHGFGDDEIDTIFPFLTHFPFQDGDLLAQKGEQASWVGVLLTGQLDAKTDDGKVLGQLKPGFIVGEMALFRGGTRFCDLVGNGAGALAALLFADIPRMFDTAPTLAYRLVVAFGKAAAAKFVLPHPPPSGQPTKPPPGGRTGRRNSVATESAVQRRALTEALGRRGLASKEVAQLLGVLIVSEFGPGAVLMQEGRELRHVGIVMEVRRGVIARREQPSPPPCPPPPPASPPPCFPLGRSMPSLALVHLDSPCAPAPLPPSYSPLTTPSAAAALA